MSSSRLLCVPLLLALAGGALGQDAQPAPAPHTRVQGITVSCQTWGGEWGSDDMLVALDAIKALGGNWVQIHPYAGIHADGTVRTWRLGDEAPSWLTRPIAEAHARGLKVLIKPHLAYWGSPFKWRGEIAFKTDAEWRRFWTGYSSWLLKIVRFCKDADAFAVGTELDKTLAHDARWRELIAGVRKLTKAPLTYAANWTDYQRVGFWDALDIIGVQGYFPLTQAKQPTDAQLAAGWKTVLADLTAYAKGQQRNVVFTELGYDRSNLAASKPWQSQRDPGPEAAALQKRCMQAALAALADHDTVVGAFLWKWFAGRTRSEDFLLSTPRMRDAIRGAWKPKPKRGPF